MIKRRFLAPLLPLVLMLASCDSPAGEGGRGWMQASLTGTISGDYTGDGDFLSQTDRAEGPRTTFSLNSSSNVPSWQAFDFYRYNGTRPRAGRYELELIDQSDYSAEGFFAFYSRVDGDYVEHYAARSGWVEVTASSRDRVEGTFHLVAMRYCREHMYGGAPQEGPCQPPAAPIEGAPTIEVSGSFSAVQADDEVYTGFED